MAANGTIQVLIEGDDERAVLVLPESAPPEQISAEALVGAVREAGVAIDGPVEQRLQQIAEAFAAAPAPMREVIAERIEPTPGRDGWIEWVEGRDPTSACQSPGERAGEHGAGEESVDHYAGCTFIRVTAGDPLGTLHEPEPGEDGRSVRGEPIKATPGRPCPIRFDGAIKVENAAIIAQQEGILSLQDQTLSIINVLDVPGYVDFSTGNIDFDGAVDIREGIRDRFIVNATGDVTVGGLVEAATIVCGGRLTCRRGIAARDRGQILVAGDAESGYLNNVRGRVAGSLTVRREILNCQLAVGGDVRCDQGSLIGGVLIVTGKLHIATVGSDGYTPTTLRLGEVPLLAEHLRKVDRAVKIATDRLNRERVRHDEVAAVTRKGVSSGPLAEIRKIVSDLERKVDGLQSWRKEILQRIDALRNVDARISRMIHPKVSVRAGGVEVMFEDAIKGPVQIIWNAQRVPLIRFGDSGRKTLAEVAHVTRDAA